MTPCPEPLIQIKKKLYFIYFKVFLILQWKDRHLPAPTNLEGDSKQKLF